MQLTEENFFFFFFFFLIYLCQGAINGGKINCIFYSIIKLFIGKRPFLVDMSHEVLRCHDIEGCKQ